MERVWDEIFKDWYHQFDVGIVFYEEDCWAVGDEKGHKDRLICRNNVKVTNNASYGIPTVTSPYSSYIETLGDTGAITVVRNFYEAIQALDELIKDPSKRYEMRKAALQARDRFHPATIAKDYISLFEEVLSK